MNTRLNEILTEIRELEKSVQEELKRREEELKYTVKKGREKAPCDAGAPLHAQWTLT